MRTKQQPRRSVDGRAGISWIRERLPDYQIRWSRLENWLSGVAGVTGEDLLCALYVCALQDIEGVDDLEYMYSRGKLQLIGYSDRTLSKISSALSSE